LPAPDADTLADLEQRLSWQAATPKPRLVISASALHLYHECPRRFRYLWQLRLRDPGASPDPLAAREQEGADRLGAADLGTLAHQVLAGLDFAGLRGNPDAWSLPASLQSLALADQRDLERFVQTALESDLGAEIAAAERVESEVSFSLRIGDEPNWLEGRIDLLCRGKDGPLIVDWKTDRVAPESLREHAERYHPQLWAYRAALREEGDAEPRTDLFFLRLGERVQVEPQAGNEADVAAVFRGIRAELLDVTGPHRGCVECPFKSHCRHAKQAEGNFDAYKMIEPTPAPYRPSGD